MSDETEDAQAQCRRLEAQLALLTSRLRTLERVDEVHQASREALEQQLAAAHERVLASDEELHRLRQRLADAQRLEALGRVVGGVAHDFNTLLTVILSHARFAQAALPVGTQPAEDLTSVIDAANRGVRLTGQLLSAGRTPGCRPSVIDLNAVTRSLLHVLRKAFAPGTALDLRLEPSIASVRFDPVHLEQVLLNLVTNARDAMPGGGTLTVATRLAVAADWPGAPTANMVTLSVADTGVGMPPETLARVFEPYFTTKTAGQGTGLGLSTAQELVQQNGGHLSVVSAPGQGTTFSIVMPEAEARSAGRDGGGLPRPRPKVMVVEDEDLVRRMACRVLRRSGFDVCEARDGQEALDSVVPREAPDVVLTDLMMPSLGGRELAAQLRRADPALKVVFMSGVDAPRGEAGAGWLDSDPFLSKPFTAEELTRAIAATLRS